MNLLFCTGLVNSTEAWRERYRPWAEHHRNRIDSDTIFIIDDGGTHMPDDSDVSVVSVPPDAPERDRIYLLRFADRLGRRGQFDFPGWWRSFEAGIGLAQRYDATRLIHVESDARVLSDRLARALSQAAKGWVALWCPSYRVPEPSIQVIHRDSLPAASGFAAQRPKLDMAGKGPELLLPFTSVEQRLIGDRYAEFGRTVPEGADYACQIFGSGQ